MPRFFDRLILAVALMLPTTAFAQLFEGPYPGEVVRIIDGDTFEANVKIWPTVSTTVSVRIRGIDAPETHRPACDEEAFKGDRARAELTERLPVGEPIELENVVADSFAGRVIADVMKQNERRVSNVGTLMARSQYVVEWVPGGEEKDWCAPD